MLQELVDWIMYSLLSLNPETKIMSTINFFIYDSIKIFLLIFVMISLIGFFRTYISNDKVKKYLSKRKGPIPYILASLFGSLTPFCSCSSIPLFFGFLEAGVPLGVTFSFLVTSPLVNEYLVVLMWGFFGWKITLAYVIFGILIGVIAGWILGKLDLESLLHKEFRIKRKTGKCCSTEFKTLRSRINFGLGEAKKIVKKLWIWILIGVGIGAIIHNYVPQAFFTGLVEHTGLLTVPLATVVGVPMYGNCVAIVPIATALFEKGLPLGTALAFMMATSALSIPEAIILKSAMKTKLILIFFSIVTIGIILTGYIFNVLQLFLM